MNIYNYSGLFFRYIKRALFSLRDSHSDILLYYSIKLSFLPLKGTPSSTFAPHSTLKAPKILFLESYRALIDSSSE